MELEQQKKALEAFVGQGNSVTERMALAGATEGGLAMQEAIFKQYQARCCGSGRDYSSRVGNWKTVKSNESSRVQVVMICFCYHVIFAFHCYEKNKRKTQNNRTNETAYSLRLAYLLYTFSMPI